MFYCYFRQGCNCVNQIPNYAVKAIVIPFGFNFKVFLSENLLVQSSFPGYAAQPEQGRS